MKKERSNNFELLRIISMIMILVLHFNLYGVKYNQIPSTDWHYYFFWTLEYICIIAVNIYVLISGYFLIKSNIKLKKALKLEFQIIFYSIIIYLIMIVINKESFNLRVFIKLFFPISTKQYWFMGAYLVMYLLVPFINKLANSLTKAQYKTLLIVLIIFYSLIPTLFQKNNVVNTYGGYSSLWFIILYLVAGYIRLYVEKKYSKIGLSIIFVLMVAINMIVRVLMQKITGIEILTEYLKISTNYNSIIILIQSIVFFLIFKEIKIKNGILNKIILFFSPLTLGVYLIHENNYLRTIIWKDIVHPRQYLSDYKIFIYMMISIISIFFICCMIEKIRQIIFILLEKLKCIKKIDRKLDNIKILEE